MALDIQGARTKALTDRATSRIFGVLVDVCGICICICIGAGGAAAVGIGVLLTTQSGLPATTVRAVELASFDSLMVPAAPVSAEPWWTPTGNRAGNPGAASVSAVAMVGPGGWLVGDGADGDAGTNQAGGSGGAGGQGGSGEDGGRSSDVSRD